jgi:aquaporin NIP
MNENLLKSSIAEAVGTFILVFIGCGAILVNESSGGALGHAGVAMTVGLTVMTVIFAIGHVSGAHINPAVTIALAMIKRVSMSKMLCYCVAQVSGAILAAIALKYSVATGDSLGVTAPVGTISQAFLMEMLMTAFLVFMVVSLVTDPRASSSMAAIAIGGVITVDAFVGGPITGASMNPARSFGPALVSGQLEHLWLYIVAPIMGGIIGAGLYWMIGARTLTNPRPS